MAKNREMMKRRRFTMPSCRLQRSLSLSSVSTLPDRDCEEYLPLSGDSEPIHFSSLPVLQKLSCKFRNESQLKGTSDEPSPQQFLRLRPPALPDFQPQARLQQLSRWALSGRSSLPLGWFFLHSTEVHKCESCQWIHLSSKSRKLRLRIVGKEMENKGASFWSIHPTICKFLIVQHPLIFPLE